MDIEQLRTFDRIARDLSFTKAAARLNVTQATVSMRMRALEDLLGVSLFHRGRIVSLTDQGQTFLPYARRMLNATHEANAALRRSERGSVSIVCLRSMVSALITDALIRYQHIHPAVDIAVHEGKHTHLTAMLHERRAELGIIAWPNLDSLVTDLVPLMVMRERVPLVIAPCIAQHLPPSPTLAEIIALQPRAISVSWWQVEPDSAKTIKRHAASTIELPTGTARRMAIRCEGFGLFAHSAVRDDLEAGRLVELTPCDLEPSYRDTALVAISEEVLNRQAVRDFAREVAIECARAGTVIENRLDYMPLAAE